MTDYTDHHAPEGLRVRGTVVVVPGRGETRDTYARFGGRLAADAYRVRVIDPPLLDADDPAATDDLASRIGDAVDGTAAGDGVVRPVVLVGADAGAAAVAAPVGPG
jgi:alpha-beta hydrolase superfamily lysophospholipase